MKDTLKTSRKALLVVALLLCIAGSGLAAYCYIWVTSNQVHVDMQYSVALSSSVSDSNVTLTATVTNNNNPIRAGIVVDFYYSVNAGVDWTYFATQLTDAAGVARVIYTATVAGGYDFKAVVTVP